MRLPSGSVITKFGKLPSVFARIKGKSGITMEYDCLIDPASEYCTIPKLDAYTLGYPEVAFQHVTVGPPNARTILTNGGHNRTVIVEMRSIEIGPLKFEGVQFAPLDLPQASGYEALIGKSLLERVSFTINWPDRTMELVKLA